MSSIPVDRSNRGSWRLGRRLVLGLAVTATSCAATKSEPLVGVSTVRSAAIPRDPLGSWTDGPSKRAIVDFVVRVSAPGSPSVVPIPDRIAVFGNNGTLWPAKPNPGAAFISARVRTRAMEKARLRDSSTLDSVMNQGHGGVASASMESVFSALVDTYAGTTDEAFEADVRSFLSNERHPRFDASYTSLTYKPMRELYAYLRAHGFTVYLCTDEDEDFARIFAGEAYGIARENVIGSTIEKDLPMIDGRLALRRTSEIASFNDANEKVVNISRRLGRRPLMAVGQVGTGDDVAMMTYTKGNTAPSLELVIHHDDPSREISYPDQDGATLAKARERGFVVVSMKTDWSDVFDTRAPKR